MSDDMLKYRCTLSAVAHDKYFDLVCNVRQARADAAHALFHMRAPMVPHRCEYYSPV
jgi:hypothetical protein